MNDDASSSCCEPPAEPLHRRRWLRTLVFVVVMLAACCVGAYSFMKRTGEDPAAVEAPDSPIDPTQDESAPHEAKPCCPSAEEAAPTCGGQPEPCCGQE